jgi:hypothetical protein
MEEAVEAGELPEPKETPPGNKKLCIGSIFPNCNELSRKWLDLQLRYVKASTNVEFRHISVVQEGAVSPFFENNTHVVKQDKKPGKNSTAHVRGLEKLQSYYMSSLNDSEYFLFIDMDAFPIRTDWYDILTNKMTNRNFEIAVALRPENLEQRLHSSVLMVRHAAVPQLRWGVSKVGRDLIGGTESDVHLISHQTGGPRNNSFVLLRSNMHQIHPLLCGVYYDLFYHHGCGSGRNFNMRARPYWAHLIPPKFDVMRTIDDLMNDPNEFIGKLVGWENAAYAKV